MQTSEINIKIADLAHKKHITLAEAVALIQEEEETEERWDTDYSE
jgi:hypothetical protein